MLIIAASGGSGSSWLGSTLFDHGVHVCLRPDSGYQKPGRDMWEVAHRRLRAFMQYPRETFALDTFFSDVWAELRTKPGVLLSMTWGGMGLLNTIPERCVWFLRHPVHSYNSFMGGGWRDAGGQRRIKALGGKDANDPVVVDAFLGHFSHWLDMATYALEMHYKRGDYIVRYDRFADDWPACADACGLPNIVRDFRNKNDWCKVERYLQGNTIARIMREGSAVWDKIQAL